VISCSATHPSMRANYSPSCNAMHKCNAHTTLQNKGILPKLVIYTLLTYRLVLLLRFLLSAATSCTIGTASCQQGRLEVATQLCFNLSDVWSALRSCSTGKGWREGEEEERRAGEDSGGNRGKGRGHIKAKGVSDFMFGSHFGG
jgi:hypothetical protein